MRIFIFCTLVMGIPGCGKSTSTDDSGPGINLRLILPRDLPAGSARLRRLTASGAFLKMTFVPETGARQESTHGLEGGRLLFIKAELGKGEVLAQVWLPSVKEGPILEGRKILEARTSEGVRLYLRWVKEARELF